MKEEKFFKDEPKPFKHLEKIEDFCREVRIIISQIQNEVILIIRDLNRLGYSNNKKVSENGLK